MLKVRVLATDTCTVSGVYGILDAFFAANYCSKERFNVDESMLIDSQIVTIDDQPVHGYNGIVITPTARINKHELPDIIVVSATVEVVVGCDKAQIRNKEEIEQWLKWCHQQGVVVASYCTGAFILGAAGLLNGKVATTHWRSEHVFRKLFPFVKLDVGQLIVDNGDVICSGGSLSYIDLTLHIIQRFISKDIASDCAKLLVFDPIRQKQSPYVNRTQSKKHEDQPILEAQEWLEGHYKKDIHIDDVAAKVGLTSRTFKRRFKQATNENPINYVQRLRVEHVKDRLEKTTESINKIVWSVGYEDIGSFRQLFKRFTGLTPKEYRQKFG